MARDEPFAVKWVKRESKACVCARKQVAQHNRQRWNGCPVISSEKCSNQTKQRVCSTFFGFQQDMLNRRCSTPGTQAHWINKHHRSKEDCCVSLNPVFVWANTQWAGKYHLSYVFYLIFPKWIAFAPFKNHCWLYIFRKWESCEFTLNCGWVSFHFKSHFFLFLPALVDHANDYLGRTMALGFFCFPHVSESHNAGVYFCKHCSLHCLLCFTQWHRGNLHLQSSHTSYTWQQTQLSGV